MSDRPLGDSSSARAENRRLTSVLTPLFKLGFPATIIVIGAICTYADLKQQPHMTLFGLAVAWGFLLLLAYWYVPLKKVVACSDHLLVSNYITAACIPYDDIDEVRIRRERGPVFVRLRLRTGCQFGRTIHFLLPSTVSSVESQPEVQLLRERCPQLRERSGSWWLATVYLLSADRQD